MGNSGSMRPSHPPDSGLAWLVHGELMTAPPRRWRMWPGLLALVYDDRFKIIKYLDQGFVAAPRDLEEQAPIEELQIMVLLGHNCITVTQNGQIVIPMDMTADSLFLMRLSMMTYTLGRVFEDFEDQNEDMSMVQFNWLIPHEQYDEDMPAFIILIDRFADENISVEVMCLFSLSTNDIFVFLNIVIKTHNQSGVEIIELDEDDMVYSAPSEPEMILTYNQADHFDYFGHMEDQTTQEEDLSIALVDLLHEAAGEENSDNMSILTEINSLQSYEEGNAYFAFFSVRFYGGLQVNVLLMFMVSGGAILMFIIIHLLVPSVSGVLIQEIGDDNIMLGLANDTEDEERRVIIYEERSLNFGLANNQGGEEEKGPLVVYQDMNHNGIGIYEIEEENNNGSRIYEEEENSNFGIEEEGSNNNNNDINNDIILTTTEAEENSNNGLGTEEEEEGSNNNDIILTITEEEAHTEPDRNSATMTASGGGKEAAGPSNVASLINFFENMDRRGKQEASNVCSSSRATPPKRTRSVKAEIIFTPPLAPSSIMEIPAPPVNAAAPPPVVVPNIEIPQPAATASSQSKVGVPAAPAEEPPNYPQLIMNPAPPPELTATGRPRRPDRPLYRPPKMRGLEIKKGGGRG